MQRKKSWVIDESAVSETVRRVNAKALALLNRRREINRRIRNLHQVVQGLRDLASNAKTIDAVPITAQGLREESHGAAQSCGAERMRGAATRQVRDRLAGSSKQPPAGLTRACRIALMEAGAASLNEIRTRIDRRGSFIFANVKCADTEILQTLSAMEAEGEIRCVKGAPQHLWQREELR